MPGLTQRGVMSVRELAKTLVRGVATIVVSPVLLLHAIKVPLLGKDRALEGSTQFLSLVPGVTGQYLRAAFMVWTVRECHPSASIGFGTIFAKTDLRIGKHAYIGPYCSVGNATIEDDVLIATGTHILSGGRIHGTDDPNIPIRLQPGVLLHVTIGQGSWIGAGAVILADVGKNSIVGAGSVVTKAIPDLVVAAGVPAKVIRSRGA